MSYAKISEFGKGAAYAPVNHPLTYGLSSGLDNMFMHGGKSKKSDSSSREFAAYTGEYCSKNFDGFCKLMTQNDDIQYFPDILHGHHEGGMPKSMTKGDVVLLNTARTKYLMRMFGGIANKVPFDPTVAASPLVTIWSGDYMKGEYYIPEGHDVDNDPVMQRLLNKPLVSLPLLMNIYATMTRLGRIGELKGTKLGQFYSNMGQYAPTYGFAGMNQLSAGVML